MYHFVTILIFFPIVFCVTVNQDLVIWTEKGLISGTILNTRCYPAKAWLGIPYAEPPIGKLRFKPPVPKSCWDGVIDASTLPKSCIQARFDETKLNLFNVKKDDMSEDCLFLNVITPLNSGHPKCKLPVMVYIYGGEFTIGSSAMPMYNAQCLATIGNVIVVTLNYRVHSLGFLRIDDNTAAGNMGLLDQQLALKWVKENIWLFGGDPQKITLFGQSAGAASITYHLLMSESQGLFNRIILQSGTLLSGWAFIPPEKSLKNAHVLGEAVNCTNLTNNTALFECLQETDPHKLVSSTPTIFFPYFVPTIDGTHIRATPEDLLDEKQFAGLEIMLGATENEMELTAYRVLHFFNISADQITLQNATALIQSSFYPQNPLLAEQVTKLYAIQDRSGIFKAASNAASDISINCPSSDFEDIMLQKYAKLYKYKFVHKTKNAPWANITGAIHNEDLLYIFGVPYWPDSPIQFTEEEKRFSQSMIYLWTEFAKYGRPGHSSWIRTSFVDREYAVINTTCLVMKRTCKTDICPMVKNLLHMNNVTYW